MMHILTFRDISLPFILTVLVAVMFAPDCYAQNKNDLPREGSVHFGRKSPPIQWDEQEIAPFRDVFGNVSQEVIPSVVSIIPTRIDTVLYYRNPFYRFFDDIPFFGPPNGGEPQVQKRERRVQGLGSGFIISPEGYILTNYHVVAGAKQIEIRLADERVFPGKIVGTDSLSDVAVIQIDGDVPDDLPIVYLGNSDNIQVGDWVAAVGNPFSLSSTFTTGVISATGRQLQNGILYQNFLQTDAAINPGNSGGPLVNIYGAVIGVNTLIFSQTGGFLGIGFAIPINMALRVAQDLIYKGEVVRGWIGVSVQPLTPKLREGMGIEVREGVLIADVFEDGPADKAGIRAGDVILSIAGIQVQDPNDLLNAVATLPPGEKAPVTIIRDGNRKELTIEIAQRTAEAMGEQEQQERPLSARRPGKVENKLGIGVEKITREIRRQLDLPGDIDGVVVTRVAPDIADERAGLLIGDVIMRAKAGGKKWMDIESLRDFNRFTNGLKAGTTVVLQVFRQGNTLFVPFEIREE
ncbi:MAG: Do family serine endopeptidase [Chitinivibrionales bacterium]|nr:Do family serine endopeptidase [Chitinivibrionales bacterium]